MTHQFKPLKQQEEQEVLIFALSVGLVVTLGR